MSSLRTQALKYVLLPGFMPRIAALFTGGFAHIAWFTALVYEAVRLLPPDHPYLNPANRGLYGIRHVIAAAANNLVLSRKNIDQVIVFSVVLGGMILMLVQGILLIMALLAEQHVMAQPLVSSPNLIRDLFSVSSPYGHDNAGPSQDLAFIIFDRVFGVRNIFGSCVSTPANCLDLNGNIIPTPGAYPYPIHIAFHNLLRYYSFGIFLVAVFIILYFATTMVAETAVTGTPFGQRTTKPWAFIRLIVFFALLVPLNVGAVNGGINGAQLIVLWTAKIGSNFATNAWGRFNRNLTNNTLAGSTNNTYLGPRDSLIAQTELPRLNGLIQAMFLAKVCKYITEATYPALTVNGRVGYGVQLYLVRPDGTDQVLPGNNALLAEMTDFDTAVKHASYGNIRMRAGVRDKRPVKNPSDPDTDPFKYKDAKYSSQWGDVFSYCGDFQINITDFDTNFGTASGSMQLTERYYDMMIELWTDQDINRYALCIKEKAINGLANSCTPSISTLPAVDFFMVKHAAYRAALQSDLETLINDKIQNGDWAVPRTLREKGWAGAAIWYNRVAQMNGEVTDAITNLPGVVQYPHVMTFIAQVRREYNPDVPESKLFEPFTGSDFTIGYPMAEDAKIAATLSAAHNLMLNVDIEKDAFTYVTGSPLIDSINWLFGTSGIYTIRNNIDIHPLAQLSTLGKSMMNAATRNLGYGIMGGLGKMPLDGVPKQFIGVGAEFYKSVAFITLALSFTMYVVLPFMPFIYFFFAVSGWTKSIFEAVVAMPLWATAHLRIDGPGLPGQGAANGYFLLLEIFIRPILIIFGFLAGINMYTALVVVTNDIYGIVVANVGGFDVASATGGTNDDLMEWMRSPIDEFMYTVMYVIIVFMLGQGCFKLIDAVPNNILRWAGTSVATFQENAGDPAGRTLGMTYQGISLGTGQIQGGALALLR